MDKIEIEQICLDYLKRVSDFEFNNNVGIARSRESNIRKYIANRARQLGIFIADAISLKDIEYEIETQCENPRFTPNGVQYYALSATQLESYFAYRTFVRNNKVPEQNHVNFLVLYLMEIVNGIYGFSFNDKFRKLNSVLALYPSGAKYRNIIQEAYEILYLQNINSINKEDYFNSVPLKIFDKTSLAFNSLKNPNSLALEDIFTLVKLDKLTTFSEKDKFLLRECFDFVYSQLDNDLDFEIGSYKSISDLFSFDYKESFDVPLNKLKAVYPIHLNFSYSNSNGTIEEFRSGIHIKKKIFYTDYKLSKITIFLTYLINAIQHNCGNVPLPKKPKIKRAVYSYFTDVYKENEIDEQEIIDKIVSSWVDNNPYAKNGLFLSLAELKRRKGLESFSLNISNVHEVRKKSIEIQDKLIIEDEEINQSNNSKSLRDMFVVSSKEKVKEVVNTSDNKIVTLINNLRDWEKLILINLCSDNVTVASEIASANLDMLSLVIDRINNLSEEYIEDILILDNEVLEDYKDDLIIALK